MNGIFTLIRSTSGAAAAEMVLIMPFLLTLLFGAVEVSGYFYYQHLLEKALRDGARYAARQDYSSYTCGSTVPTTTPGSVGANVVELVQTSLLAGGTDRMPNWNPNTITIAIACSASATGTDTGASAQNMTGIYAGKVGGAPVVTVTANVPYVPLAGAIFGFNPNGLRLRGAQQAVVAGI